MSGWKLVPVEPTPEMIEAGYAATITGTVRGQWEAMLAAAPEPEPVSRKSLEKALRRAYHLGQTFWQQADSESHAQNRRAGQTKLTFEALVNETVAAAPEPESEPVYWQWRRKGQPWSLEKTFNSEVQVTTKDSERRALYTAPQPAKQPLTDEQIDTITREPLNALLDHVYEFGTNSEGPERFIRKLARAIEAKIMGNEQ